MHISQIILANILPHKSTTNKPVILITPLYWGLGHATRCIPIVRILESIDCHVIIGGNKAIHAVFKAEFPLIECVIIPQNDISYGKDKLSTQWKLVQESAKLFTTISKEKLWISDFLKKRKVDGIISDNRYGCFHPSVNSVIITHQLSISTPFGKPGNYLARKLNLRWLKPFNEVWVPDFEGEAALAGALSASQAFSQQLNISYLGPLSRMLAGKEHSPYEMVLLLSGPEPQRSILESLLRNQITPLPYKTLLVRGVVNEAAPIIIESEHLEVIDYATSDQLEIWLSRAEWIISRSGYTTVMDLSTLGKKAILIPTPGQSEQEHLARHLAATGKFYWTSQDALNLPADLEQAALFYKLNPVKITPPGIVKAIVTNWVASLQ